MNTIILLGSILLVILLLGLSVFWAAGSILPMLFRGGPFIPSSGKITQKMLELADIRESDHVFDLGSGDGRLLIGALRAGAQKATGYEIHPGLVWLSRWWAKHAGFQTKMTIHQTSLWHADVSQATVVFLYQLPNTMKALEQRLYEQLPKGARVIVHDFAFTEWIPTQTTEHVLVYQKK